MYHGSFGKLFDPGDDLEKPISTKLTIYSLLSGLALSDLCAGLISEPVYITLQVLVIVNGDAPCAVLVTSFLLNYYLVG